MHEDSVHLHNLHSRCIYLTYAYVCGMHVIMPFAGSAFYCSHSIGFNKNEIQYKHN